MKQTLKEIVIRGTAVRLCLDSVSGAPFFTVEVGRETVFGSLDRRAAVEAFGRECEKAGGVGGERPQ
ncbi:MAG: hypothetical protein IJ678_08160 [Kiritimatiellae bacterium]|nr:hypothetical protein [Kiritimatiellia bacterium]